MTSIDTVSRPLVHRAHSLAGLAACAVAVAIASPVALALGITAHFVSWPVLDVPGVSLVFVIVAAASAYGAGRARPVAISSLLLRADVGLGTEARLSTLHAIRDRPDLQPFAVRIAAGLPARPLTPHIALPIPRRVTGLLAAGIALALATVVVMAALPGSRAQAPHPAASPGTSLPADALSRRASADLSTADPVRPQASSDGLAPKAPPSTAPAVSSSATAETDVDVSDLPTRPQSTLSLEETLQRIEGRVAADQESSLSDSELASLRSFADASPSPLAEALQELMAASTRAESLTRIRTVLSRPDVAAQGGTRDGEVPSAGGVLESVAAGPEGQSAPTQPGLPASTPEVPSGHGTYPIFDEPTGGPAEITLVGSTLPSAIGTAGEYSYYVTKSVPVEPPVADPSTPPGTPLSLSFERATSIAASRALASDVLGAVRAYFTQITEGGP